MPGSEVYLREVTAALPRLLASFDRDPTSPTRGCGDRFFWAWKLIDFPNATFQGAANGLARLVTHRLLPEWMADDGVLHRIGAIFDATGRMTRRNGSLEEAFPHESSFCVTSLVAYDLLTAVRLLADRQDAATRDARLAIIEPLVRFVRRSDETHGVIGNHLATAAAALFLWADLTGESDAAGGRLLDRLLAMRNREGWFSEYGGADPGYQSLGLYYLADLHGRRPELKLGEPLADAVRFVWHFAHPDGSYGGVYASRNTRFCVPAGFEALAGESDEAAAMAAFTRRSIASRRTVTLASMDPPNLVPMFNAYCWAAALAASSDQGASPPPPLPAERGRTDRVTFPEAGLLIDRGPRHSTIVALRKGGACYHFVDGRAARRDGGFAAVDPKGRWYSTQNAQPIDPPQITDQAVRIDSPLVAMRRALPTPGRFIVLRVLCVTAMRIGFVRDRIKRALVGLLITGGRGGSAYNSRVIRLGADLTITDELHDPSGRLQPVELAEPFSAIHMASAGYWQRSDDDPEA